MFILIMGVTGSGKTTVGERLSVDLGWPFFDADDFHPPANVRKMADGIPLTDEDRAAWLVTLHDLIAEHEGRGENGVLACSALKESYRTILASGADLAVVYLKAEPDLIRARLADRHGHYMSPSLVESQFNDLEEPQAVVTVAAGWPPERIVDQIRTRLGV
jgi:gluconokinase